LTEHKTVIIDLEESEKVRLDGLSALQGVETSCVLRVKNPTEKNRIWNVKIHVPGSRSGTDIAQDVLSAGEIDAGHSWQSNYKVKVDAPILKLSETYDACQVATEDVRWAYVSGKENAVRITLRVKNESDGQFDAVVVNKSIPSELSNVQVENVQSGVAEFDEGTRQVVWKDFVVFPHEESVLRLTAVAALDDAEPKNGGEVVVTYKAEGQQRSTLSPDLTSLTDFVTGIDTTETKPNHWVCELECSNESELIVRLDKAEVYLTPEAGGAKKKMVDQSPKVELAPGKSWSTKFEVDSKAPPKCTQEVVYTPIRKITKRVLGKIEKAGQTLPVARIEYTKAFDPPEVNSLDKTPVEVNVEIKNTGSARLNEIILEDSLPDDVIPPKKEHIGVWVADKKYTGLLDVTIDPDNQDPSVAHRLVMRLSGLADTVGELQPGQSVKVNYAVMAWRNRPEKQYPSPIHCYANTLPAGLAAEAFSETDGHKLGIVYKKRAISAKKGINKGAKTGEYVILLSVENKGEVTVENVQVSDWIPSGFALIVTEPKEEEPKVQQVGDGTTLSWTWTRMNPGDKKKLNITVQGEGEYERREPTVVSD